VRLWVGRGVATAIGAALLWVVASSGAGWLDSWFGRGGSEAASYVVEPITFEVSLTESGELEPRESVNVKCEVEGMSTILFLIPESTPVKKGDLLVELASDTLVDRLEAEEIELKKIQADYKAAQGDLEIQRDQNESDIKKAEIDLRVAKLELEKYVEGDFPQKKESVQLDIKQTEMDIKRKDDELTKNKGLLEKKFVTKAKIEQLDFELQKARMLQEKHKRSMEILLDYEEPKLKMQKTSDVERAGEELARVKSRGKSREEQALAKVQQYEGLLAMRTSRFERMKLQLKNCKLYAPSDGIVQYPGGEGRHFSENDRIAEGQKVREGQTLIALPDTSQMIVTTRVHEADRHLMSPGLPCIVRVPAVPGQTFTGRIKSIGRFADSANRWLNPELKEHTTEVLLDEFDAPLSPGDSAEVKILIDTVEGVLAVPVQCVFARGRSNFVFVKRGGEYKPVEVKLGRSNATLVEVTDGIQAGDKVRMYADDALLASLPVADTPGPEIKMNDKPRPTGRRGPPRGARRRKAG